MLSAKFADGVWTVEVVGLWHFVAKHIPTPPGYAGPTREPWKYIDFVAGCTREIDASTAHLDSQSSTIVTATPPRE